MVKGLQLQYNISRCASFKFNGSFSEKDQTESESEREQTQLPSVKDLPSYMNCCEEHRKLRKRSFYGESTTQ